MVKMGIKYKVESSFEYQGFPCLGLFYERGHRCGYVGIPPEHPFFEKEDIGQDVEANGGIYFTMHHPKFDKVAGVENYWWIGWDYDHSWDQKDFEAWHTYFPEEMEIELNAGRASRYGRIFSRMASAGDVKGECVGVINQILELSGKSANQSGSPTEEEQKEVAEVSGEEIMGEQKEYKQQCGCQVPVDYSHWQAMKKIMPDYALDSSAEIASALMRVELDKCLAAMFEDISADMGEEKYESVIINLQLRATGIKHEQD